MPSTNTQPKVLVAEDDKPMRATLARVLQFENFELATVADGAAALEAVACYEPDLLLMDIRMPLVDGLTVCRRMRARGDQTPILLVTGKAAVEDLVAGLDAGADDYLVKPFEMDELIARVNSLLRRSSADCELPLRACGVVLDAARHTSYIHGRALHLTRTEFQLLELFVRNAGIVLPRSTLYSEVWGHDFTGDSKALDVQVSCLRKKLESAGETRVLQTVRGVGYVLRLPQAEGQSP